MCGLPNYKQESMVIDLYPILRTNDSLNAMAGAVALDPPIFQHYSQVGMHEKDK